jgi:hypothetical protein
MARGSATASQALLGSRCDFGERQVRAVTWEADTGWPLVNAESVARIISVPLM